MKKTWVVLLILLLCVKAQAAPPWGSGFNQGDLNLNKNSVVLHEKDANPSTPLADEGNIFVKDNSGTTTPYFIDSNGTVTSLLGGSASSVTDNDFGDITISGGVWGIDADSVALSTDTTGNYVASLVAGTGIDVGAAAEGGTPTIDVDTTEIGTTTYGSGSAIVVTHDASGGTDCSETYGDGTVTHSCSQAQTGAGAISSTGSITVTLDSDNNASESLIVKDGAAATIMSLTEAGVLDLVAGSLAVADTALTAGRSLTLSTNDVLADAELYTDFKSLTIEAPVDADNLLIFTAPFAMTVTEVACIVEAATSAAITFQECDSAGDNCATIEGLTCDVDGANSTSIDGAGLDDGDQIRIDIGTVTGTVGHVNATLTFTKDD